MVGIGITTYLRPDCLAKCVESIHKHTDMTNVTMHIADDSIERKGVAFRKNECLRALKDCSHVFLLDDDVKIIKDKWVEFFVNSGKEHLLFLNDKLHNKWEHQPMDKTILYRDCGGVFMFLTKETISWVGAFDEQYETWGLEHADYSKRVHMAGLNSFGKYLCIEGTENYIYSEDYSNPNHKSSITNEEKNLLFKKNFPKFAKGIKSIYLPL